MGRWIWGASLVTGLGIGLIVALSSDASTKRPFEWWEYLVFTLVFGFPAFFGASLFFAAVATVIQAFLRWRRLGYWLIELTAHSGHGEHRRQSAPHEIVIRAVTSEEAVWRGKRSVPWELARQALPAGASPLGGDTPVYQSRIIGWSKRRRGPFLKVEEGRFLQ
jgi:hypothetical protein